MTKKCFSLQNEPHTYEFRLFSSFFTQIDKNFSFWSKKCFSHQNAPHTGALSFSAVLKHFFRNFPLNLSFRTKKCFSHQNGPYIAKLSFSVVLKHFYGICQKKKLPLLKKSFSQQNEPHPAKLSISTILKHIYGYWQKKSLFHQKVLFSLKWATYRYTKLFCCFDAFERNMIKATLLKKKCFLSRMSHIPLNYEFRLFSSIFTQIDKSYTISSKMFFSSKWATQLFCCFEAFFFKNCPKTCHLGQKSVFSSEWAI